MWPIVGGGASRPIVYPTLDRLSTDCRPLYRPSVDRLSTAISTDRSVDTTYSKHDPNRLHLRNWAGPNRRDKVCSDVFHCRRGRCLSCLIKINITRSNLLLPSWSWSDESIELSDPDLDLESEPIESESLSLRSCAFSLGLNEPLRGLGRGLILGSSLLTAEDDPVILKAL